jgi:S1-C subfamily serine protease
VVVTKVDPGSAGARFGLQVGDILDAFDRKAIVDMISFQKEQLDCLTDTTPRNLQVLRRGKHQQFLVSPLVFRGGVSFEECVVSP